MMLLFKTKILYDDEYRQSINKKCDLFINDDFLKSFNAPELVRGRIPFNAVDVANALKLPAEPFE